MESDKFIAHFAAQFEDTDLSEFSPGKKFRELEEWSSMMALSVIAMADEEYKVRLTGDDIRKSVTIGDLFEIIKSRLPE